MMGLKLSDVLFGKRQMTISAAKNILTIAGYKVSKVREGIYQLSKDWSIEVIGEQELIDRARLLDQDEQRTFEQGELE